MILMWQNIRMGHYSLQWNPIELYKKWKELCQSRKFSEITQIFDQKILFLSEVTIENSYIYCVILMNPISIRF